MRSALNWLNPRRRLIALTFLALVAVGMLSAGDTPRPDGWVRIPDLGALMIVVIGVIAVVGLVLITVARPGVEVRSRGETRSIKALLVLVAIVAAITLWFDGREVVTEPVANEQEQTTGPLGGAVGATEGVDGLGATGADLLGLALILLIVMAMLFRRSRRSRAIVAAPAPNTTSEAQLAEAVERAHHQLSEVRDPKLAVMVAYADLEEDLAGLGLRRRPAETAVEHMARALADVPELAAPVMRLGGLYEIARFSDRVITEDDRRLATEALAGAQRSLVDGAHGR